jgi:hypothetical protein
MIEIDKTIEWKLDISIALKNRIINIVSWHTEHDSNWYKIPGRTAIIFDEDTNHYYKIKGAGFYNPPNVSFSGLKRTITAVPENKHPMRPIQTAFQRDLIHIDPDSKPPYYFKSIHSINAPIGGMTYEVVLNDQNIFNSLNNSKVPSNIPLASIKYQELNLHGKIMGVSISQLPNLVLNLTPYDLYLHWYRNIDLSNLIFLKKFTRIENFNLSNPKHILYAINKLSRIAGNMILRFSMDAGLYRFSGSPDNLNMKNDYNEPFFFSDVDTSKHLKNIDMGQRPWEIIRNLITAIHQWFYFFIPSLTYSESKYRKEHFKEFDFIGGLLSGFFTKSDKKSINMVADKIWLFLDPVFDNLKNYRNINLREGEKILQESYNRPTFYFVLLKMITPLLQNSHINTFYEDHSFSSYSIDLYILESIKDESHFIHFNNYKKRFVENLIKKYC